jgi:Flp pilus assembly protein TadD
MILQPSATERIRPPSAARFPALLLIPLLAALSACSSFTNSSSVYAEQNEAALQRQQAEQERPSLNNKEVYLEMIRKMQERSLYYASLAHLDAYQNAYGSSPEVQRMRADALRLTGNASAAEAQYRQLLSGPEATAAWHGLGLLAAQRGDYAAAAVNFRKANQLDPVNATVLSDLGYALLRGDDRSTARLPLMQAAELEPDNRKILSNLALFLLLTGEPGKADGLMKRADIPADSRAEVFRQAREIGGQPIALPAQAKAAAPATATVVAVETVAATKTTAMAITPITPISTASVTKTVTASDYDGIGFMQSMLERFRRSD